MSATKGGNRHCGAPEVAPPPAPSSERQTTLIEKTLSATDEGRLELVLAVVNMLLEDVVKEPSRLVRAQEIARRDIAPLLVRPATGGTTNTVRLEEAAYVRGVEMARKLLRLQLGLATKEDRDGA